MLRVPEEKGGCQGKVGDDGMQVTYRDERNARVWFPVRETA